MKDKDVLRLQEALSLAGVESLKTAEGMLDEPSFHPTAILILGGITMAQYMTWSPTLQEYLDRKKRSQCFGTVATCSLVMLSSIAEGNVLFGSPLNDFERTEWAKGIDRVMHGAERTKSSSSDAIEWFTEYHTQYVFEMLGDTDLRKGSVVRRMVMARLLQVVGADVVVPKPAFPVDHSGGFSPTGKAWNTNIGNIFEDEMATARAMAEGARQMIESIAAVDSQ